MEKQNAQSSQRDDLSSDWPPIFRRRAIPFLTYAGVSEHDTNDVTRLLRALLPSPRSLRFRSSILRYAVYGSSSYPSVA